MTEWYVQKKKANMHWERIFHYSHLACLIRLGYLEFAPRSKIAEEPEGILSRLDKTLKDEVTWNSKARETFIHEAKTEEGVEMGNRPSGRQITFGGKEMFVCRVGARVRVSAELVLKPAKLVPMIAGFQLPGH
jgi:hypothetical protein